MVLAKKETTVAYKCPHCGALVMSLVGAFALSADMIKLKCPCGGSELTAIYTRDKKVRLSVPCITCPNPHTYNVSSQVFFGGELFRIPCALSGLDICFCGREDEVMAAAGKAEKELLEILGDTAIETLAQSRGEESLSDPQIREIVTYVVQDICADGGVHCKCDGGSRGVVIDVGNDTVTVTCKECGASAVIPADSLSRAEDFLGAEYLDLK